MEVTTIAKTTAYVPVRKPVFDQIIKSMKQSGFTWDGTLNHIDQFCWSNPASEWDRWRCLTPERKHKRIIRIPYVY